MNFNAYFWYNMNVDELLKLLQKGVNTIVTTHKNPDGDAVGSALGLAGVLEKVCPDIKVILPNEAPAFLKWMEQYDECLIFESQEEECAELIEQAEIIFCLDFNALHRTGEMGELLANSSAQKVMIDHQFQ